MPIDVADLEATLDRRTGHNEWGLADFSIRGVLAAPPWEVWDSTGLGEVAHTDLTEVVRTFSGLPIVTIGAGRFWGLNHSGVFYTR